MTEDSENLLPPPQEDRTEPQQNLWSKVKGIPHSLFGRGRERFAPPAIPEALPEPASDTKDSRLVPQPSIAAEQSSSTETAPIAGPTPAEPTSPELITEDTIPEVELKTPLPTEPSIPAETVSDVQNLAEPEEEILETEPVIPLPARAEPTKPAPSLPEYVKSANLPPGFKEVKTSDKVLEVNKADLPWLDKEAERVALVQVTVEGDPIKKTLTGEEIHNFYLGSLVRGKTLTEAASKLDRHRTEIVTNLLYTHLPQFLRGHSNIVTMLKNRRTHRPVYILANKGGQRVYFMRFNDIDEQPVIIKIAAYDKSDQVNVLRVLTTESKKRIKTVGRL